MAAPSSNQALNRLVIEIGRSLLQYLGEAWPWTDESNAPVREKIDELVGRQSEQVGLLCAMLSERNWPIDFGTYPTEYTDLQFLSLDFLLKQTLQNAERLDDVIAGIASSASQDDAAILNEVLASQREIVAELRELAAAKDDNRAA